MRFGSVCSGIEAASVAWQPLGWQAAWLAEIEPFPSAVLAHHYPDVLNLGDQIFSVAERQANPELKMGGAEKLAADSPRYKALGNSWAVPVVTWIGKRIKAAL